MSVNVLQMLASSALQPARTELRGAPVRLLLRDQSAGADAGADAAAGVQSVPVRRTRIWEFGTSLHCSIVGTCLSTAELRQILIKLRVENAASASDHDLHNFGVMFASRRSEGAKFIQKALDRRHRGAVVRFATAKDASALLALWQEALKEGDIPGAYWAVLTHPAATEGVIKRAFGDVHMLSHLVGAANRADIRRLRQLEQDNAVLIAKIERQQRQLREGFVTRDQAIQRLQGELARRADDRNSPTHQSVDSADDAIHDLNLRLSRAIARYERSEQRLVELTAMLDQKESALQAIQQSYEETRRELETVEAHLAELVPTQSEASKDAINLSGAAILYVGGRANQIPALRHLVERAGGRFLHHDGGMEHSSGLLPGLIARAAHVFFPVDCVSHEAAATVKRLCRQADKPYAPLRTASLTCLLTAIATLDQSHHGIAAE